MDNNTILGIVVASTILAAALATLSSSSSLQQSYAWINPEVDPVRKAPIAVSGENNVYVVWFTDKNTPNKNGEVMFKASTDGGKTWSNKTNLSNTPNVDSIDAEINAAANNVYVTWWERANATSNEPVMRVSGDNGKTFGEIIKLSGNSTATTAAPIG